MFRFLLSLVAVFFILLARSQSLPYRQHIFLLNSTRADQAHYNLPKLIDFVSLQPIQADILSLGFKDEDEVREYLKLLYGIKNPRIPIVNEDTALFYKLNPRGTMAWTLTDTLNQPLDTLNTWGEVELMMNEMGAAYDFIWKMDSATIPLPDSLHLDGIIPYLNNFGFLVFFDQSLGKVWHCNAFRLGDVPKPIDFGPLEKLYQAHNPQYDTSELYSYMRRSKLWSQNPKTRVTAVSVVGEYTWLQTQVYLPHLVKKKKKFIIEIDSVGILFHYQAFMKLMDYSILPAWSKPFQISSSDQFILKNLTKDTLMVWMKSIPNTSSQPDLKLAHDSNAFFPGYVKFMRYDTLLWLGAVNELSNLQRSITHQKHSATLSNRWAGLGEKKVFALQSRQWEILPLPYYFDGAFEPMWSFNKYTGVAHYDKEHSAFWWTNKTGELTGWAPWFPENKSPKCLYGRYVWFEKKDQQFMLHSGGYFDVLNRIGQ